MKVVLEPLNGTAEDNLDRAKLEIERLLAFRGSVTGVKANGTRIIVKVEISPKWDLPIEEKVDYLKEWITAKVRSAFRVTRLAR